MPLIKEKPNTNRGLMAIACLSLALFAIIIIWLGINSLLVGLAYLHQKGFWVVGLTGLILMAVGVWFLWWCVRKTAKSLSKASDMEIY